MDYRKITRCKEGLFPFLERLYLDKETDTGGDGAFGDQREVLCYGSGGSDKLFSVAGG